MKNIAPALIAFLCVLVLFTQVAPALAQVFGTISDALTIRIAEDRAGRPINQR